MANNKPPVTSKKQVLLLDENENDKVTKITLSFDADQFEKIDNLRQLCNSNNIEELFNKLFVIGQLFASANSKNYEMVLFDPANVSVAKEETKNKRKLKTKTLPRIAIVGTENNLTFVTDMVNQTLVNQKEIENIREGGWFGLIPMAQA